MNEFPGPEAAKHMRFDRWMREVDYCMREEAGVVSSDLPDKPYRDWYEDYMSPDLAARMALEEEGWDDYL